MNMYSIQGCHVLKTLLNHSDNKKSPPDGGLFLLNTYSIKRETILDTSPRVIAFPGPKLPSS